MADSLFELISVIGDLRHRTVRRVSRKSIGDNMPRVDIHTHFQCLDFVKHLRGRNAFPRAVLDGGTYAVECAAGFRIPALPKIIDMDAKLLDLEAMDITISVLSHGLPLGPDVLGAEADDWAMRINDDLARIVAAYPGKFVGFGTMGLAIRSARSPRSIDASPSSASRASRYFPISPARCSIQRSTGRYSNILAESEFPFTSTLQFRSGKWAWTIRALRCRSGFRTTRA